MFEPGDKIVMNVIFIINYVDNEIDMKVVYIINKVDDRIDLTVIFIINKGDNRIDMSNVRAFLASSIKTLCCQQLR